MHVSGGETGRHLKLRLIQKIADGKTSYELSWKVKVMKKKEKKKKKTEVHLVYIWYTEV